MANNLFVSYDLQSPGQNYEAVTVEIKKQGSWAKVHYSLFYIKSAKTASDVEKAVWAKMDPNDRLIVIDTTHNTAAWHNLSEEVSEFLKKQWHL